MHCFQVYLPSEVSYIAFGVFSMRPPVVLASLFFFSGTFLFLSSLKNIQTCLNVNVVETKNSIEDNRCAGFTLSERRIKKMVLFCFLIFASF